MIGSLTVIAASGALIVQGEVHVHGHGTLSIGADGDGRVEAMLEVPAESLWGFEHEPRTDAQRDAISNALDLLNSTSLVSFPERAGCELSSVEISGVEAADDHHDHHHGEDHAHEDHAHEDEHHDDHHHHDDHDHDDHSHDDGHAHQDITVVNVFACESADRINAISTTLFEQFPRLEELEGVYVDSSRQAGFDLSPDQPSAQLPR